MDRVGIDGHGTCKRSCLPILGSGVQLFQCILGMVSAEQSQTTASVMRSWLKTSDSRTQSRRTELGQNDAPIFKLNLYAMSVSNVTLWMLWTRLYEEAQKRKKKKRKKPTGQPLLHSVSIILVSLSMQQHYVVIYLIYQHTITVSQFSNFQT